MFVIDDDGDDAEDNSSAVRKNENVVFRDSDLFKFEKLRKYFEMYRFWPHSRSRRDDAFVENIVRLSHILQSTKRTIIIIQRKGYNYLLTNSSLELTGNASVRWFLVGR